MEQKKLEVIKALKTIFGDAEQFVITGSTVAMLQGLTDKSDDIDLVLIKPSEATMNQLLRHVNDNPIYGEKTNVKLLEKKMFVFKFQGFKVDIFVKEDKYDDKLQYDGIILSPLMKLVEAKKSYHRLKDLLQLKSWAARLFRVEDLNTELELIHMEESYVK